jgi:hypothetical protein
MDNLREQVELEMKRAWWDILKEEIYSQPPKFEQLKLILGEIHHILCSLVPHRPDIHEKIYNDFFISEPTEELQYQALKWIKKFQAPLWDSYTSEWEKRIPEDTITFLKEYYMHLDRVHEEVKELMKNNTKPKDLSEIKLKTGR